MINIVVKIPSDQELDEVHALIDELEKEESASVAKDDTTIIE